MGDEERNATSRGGRRSIGERSKTNNLLSLLEGARGAIRANDPKKFETALRAVQVDEFFVPLDTVEGKPTTLHQIVHSSPSIHDFDAFIDVLLKVVFERQPELRNEAHPLVQWANVLDGQGHTAIHKAVSLLGMKPRRPNREAPFCLHVVRSLVALGADLWHQSLEGRTALEYLFDSEGNVTLHRYN